MPRDVLKSLGLEPEADEHPADTVVLDRLGLKPETDEHPAIVADPYNLGSPEARFGRKGEPAKSALDKLHEAINPATVLPQAGADWWNNTKAYMDPSLNAITQGAGDVMNNQPATGLGRMALGAAGTVLSPVAAAVKTGVSDPLTNVTGNPDLGDKAALLMPFPGGRATNAVIDAARPSTKALDLVAERMTPEQLARLRANPRLRPMDVSKGVRDLAVGTAKDTSQPQAMAHVVSSMENSAVTAKDAVRGTYNEAMGTPPDAFEELQRLQNKAKAIGQAKIAPPLITSKPVDTSATIAAIDKELNPTAVKMTPGITITPTPLQQRLTELRQKLASGDKEVLTDADRLHDVQAELRRDAEDLMSSATGSDRRLGRQLRGFRDQLVDNIDTAAPGYKEGLKAYKDQKDIERAFQFGQNILKNTQDAETAPGFLKQWLANPNRSPEELAAAKTGARQAIEQKMGSIKSSGLDPARSGTDVPQVDFNRQKLETLFGKDATDKMFQHLHDERDIAVTNSRGLANSTTAEAQAAQQVLKPRDINVPHGGPPAWATAAGVLTGALTSPTIGAAVGGGLLGLRGIKAGYDYLGHKADLSRNASLAQLITRNDPETIDKLAAAMYRASRRNKFDHLLAPP